jgi:NADPH:quinone reductase-like Zn-dependent oxidoreductase
MKAAVYHRYGPPEAVLGVGEIDRPDVDGAKVLVRTKASAVNPVDWFYVRGEPYMIRLANGLRRPRNPVLGWVLAGMVEAVGPKVTKFQPGDEVYGEISGGGFAEYTAAPEKALTTKPASLSFEEAAAVPLVGMTALNAMRDHGKVTPGQKVLINGASGGVGTLAVQIAKLFGAEVTGVCSGRNADLVRSLGADHVVDYTRDDFVAGGPQYDVILDNVGNRSISEFRRALVAGGTYLPSTGRGGRWIGGLRLAIKATLLSPFVGHRLKAFVASGKGEDLAVLTELIEAGKVRPVIDRTYPLEDTAAAVAYYGEGHARGKVVVSVSAG